MRKTRGAREELDRAWKEREASHRDYQDYECRSDGRRDERRDGKRGERREDKREDKKREERGDCERERDRDRDRSTLWSQSASFSCSLSSYRLMAELLGPEYRVDAI